MNSDSRPWYGRWWAVSLLMAIVLATTAYVTVRALGLRTIEVTARPLPLPSQGFDYRWWDDALGRWVHGDAVDYQAVLHEENDLRRFVATFEVAGPRSTPERFSTEPERLAYYINAYNALVLLGVVDNWPIDTVHEVGGWLDPRPGFGFFYGLRFPLDDRLTNLYELENEVIRAFADARIHAAINCASESCPALVPHAFEPVTLDTQLDEAMRSFCSTSPHVVVDEKSKQIQLSAIFEWYRSDFEEHARRLGRPATIVDFIAAFARPGVASAIERARAAEFEVVFQPYDWSLNRL